LRYLFEEYAIDTDRRELHRGADVVSVAPQVFDLLDYLIRNRERVVSKDDLIDAIWNGRIVSDAALTTRLNVTRTAIGDSGEEQRLIKTLPRKGFRFVGAVLEAQGPAGPATAGQSGPRARTPGLLSLTDAVEKCRGRAKFATAGVFLFQAGRWSLIGTHHDQPGKPLTQSPRRLLLAAGRVDAAPLS